MDEWSGSVVMASLKRFDSGSVVGVAIRGAQQALHYKLEAVLAHPAWVAPTCPLTRLERPRMLADADR